MWSFTEISDNWNMISPWLPAPIRKTISLKIEGAQKLTINSQGDLILHTAGGNAKFQKPVVYQMVGAERREVAGNYALASGNRVTFAIAKYDESLPLVIDRPLLTYSTFLGGTGDESGQGIAVDGNGDAFIAGSTSSTDFPPTTNVAPVSGCGFVTELNPAGTAQLYSNYLCGTSGMDEVFALALDPSGKVYVAGTTASTDFPTTTNALIKSPLTTNPNGTAFLTKIDPTLAGTASLLYSSYIGGTNGDLANAVAADANGNAYIGGLTFSNPGRPALEVYGDIRRPSGRLPSQHFWNGILDQDRHHKIRQRQPDLLYLSRWKRRKPSQIFSRFRRCSLRSWPLILRTMLT